MVDISMENPQKWMISIGVPRFYILGNLQMKKRRVTVGITMGLWGHSGILNSDFLGDIDS